MPAYQSDTATERSAMAARLVEAAEKRSALKRAQDCYRTFKEYGLSPLRAYLAAGAVPVIAATLDRCA